MTLQQMKYIIAIANYCSFSKAAKNLFVSQSTLSTAVKETEKIWRHIHWSKIVPFEVDKKQGNKSIFLIIFLAEKDWKKL